MDSKNEISEPTMELISNKTSELLRENVVDEKIAVIRDKKVEFNLYYDKFGVPTRSTSDNSNYIKIEINVDQLKKEQPSLPQLDTKSNLKETIKQISECFMINENNKLTVDSSKLDPGSIKIVHQSHFLLDTKTRDQSNVNDKKILDIDKILNKNPESLTILLKTTKLFYNNHYLLIIYRKEVIIGTPGKY